MKWGIYKLVLRESIKIWNCKYKICGWINRKVRLLPINLLSLTKNLQETQRLHLSNLWFKNSVESWELPVHSLLSFLTWSSTKALELWSANSVTCKRGVKVRNRISGIGLCPWFYNRAFKPRSNNWTELQLVQIITCQNNLARTSKLSYLKLPEVKSGIWQLLCICSTGISSPLKAHTAEDSKLVETEKLFTVVL